MFKHKLNDLSAALQDFDSQGMDPVTKANSLAGLVAEAFRTGSECMAEQASEDHFGGRAEFSLDILHPTPEQVEKLGTLENLLAVLAERITTAGTIYSGLEPASRYKNEALDVIPVIAEAFDLGGAYMGTAITGIFPAKTFKAQYVNHFAPEADF